MINKRANEDFAGGCILLKEEDLLLLQNTCTAVNAVSKHLSSEVVSGSITKTEAPREGIDTSGGHDSEGL